MRVILQREKRMMDERKREEAAIQQAVENAPRRGGGVLPLVRKASAVPEARCQAGGHRDGRT